MYCEHCGAKLVEGASFCMMCGARTPYAENQPALSGYGPEAEQQPTPRHDRQPVSKKKPLPKYILVVIVLVAVIAVVVVQLTGSQRVKVDLNDYVTISATGSNGSGTAQVVFDYESLYADYSKKIELTEYGENSIIATYIPLIYYNPAQMLAYDYITGYADKYYGLSNGDVITYTWTFDEEEIEEYFNVELVYSDIQYTVSGLN